MYYSTAKQGLQATARLIYIYVHLYIYIFIHPTSLLCCPAPQYIYLVGLEQVVGPGGVTPGQQPFVADEENLNMGEEVVGVRGGGGGGLLGCLG